MIGPDTADRPAIQQTDVILHELRALISDLGKDGGIISPSVYDTAQVLRFYPLDDGVEPVLDWLLSQQQPDGGWGDPAFPMTRIMSTLAAIIAIKEYRDVFRPNASVERGLSFLHRQAPSWSGFSIESLPLGAELILPELARSAARRQLDVPDSVCELVRSWREDKLRRLGSESIGPGAPATYSWEALTRIVPNMVPDNSMGIGHSPAATAAWLHQTTGNRDSAELREGAKHYLRQASLATGMAIPGLFPTVWPITGFELSYGSYALLTTGLLRKPALETAVRPMLANLAAIMDRGGGVSFGEDFAPDVDDTAVSMSTLLTMGTRLNSDLLMQFWNQNHFLTFPDELNPSVLSNVHAVHALSINGERIPSVEAFILDRQSQDGLWAADKWHVSQRHVSMDATLALESLGYRAELRRIGDALTNSQHCDGGWGYGDRSIRIETSFALITLHLLLRNGLLRDKNTLNAYGRAKRWLRLDFDQGSYGSESYWLGKELYSPKRVDRVYELAAVFLASEEDARW